MRQRGVEAKWSRAPAPRLEDAATQGYLRERCYHGYYPGTMKIWETIDIVRRVCSLAYIVTVYCRSIECYVRGSLSRTILMYSLTFTAATFDFLSTPSPHAGPSHVRQCITWFHLPCRLPYDRFRIAVSHAESRAIACRQNGSSAPNQT